MQHCLHLIDYDTQRARITKDQNRYKDKLTAWAAALVWVWHHEMSLGHILDIDISFIIMCILINWSSHYQYPMDDE